MSTKQLYDNVSPLSKEKHGSWSVEVGGDFAHVKGMNVLPVLAAEFVTAYKEYPIVFSKNETTIQPVALLGIRDGENLYVDDENRWTASYLPAFLRRYPFVFARSEDGKTFTLCIDENFTGFNQDGKGERLFTDDAQPTPYVNNVLQFLQNFQNEHARSQAFCRKLDEFDLLESHNAVWTGPDGQKAALTGFFCIKREKLNNLPPKVVAGMMKRGEMDLIFAHLFSLGNFHALKEKLARLAAAGQ